MFRQSLIGVYSSYNLISLCGTLLYLVCNCKNMLFPGPINRLLSWKAFIPLSRLTYCSYLIHPLVLGWFVGTNEVQAHFSVYFVVMLFLCKYSSVVLRTRFLCRLLHALVF